MKTISDMSLIGRILVFILLNGLGNTLAEQPIDNYDYPAMSLQERVNQATVILVGKFASPISGKHQVRQISVEEILYGTLPKEKPLTVTFTCTPLLCPNINGRPPRKFESDRWIFFLTDLNVENKDESIALLRAVGPHSYAHDGLEADDSEIRAKVKSLIELRVSSQEKAVGRK